MDFINAYDKIITTAVGSLSRIFTETAISPFIYIFSPLTMKRPETDQKTSIQTNPHHPI